MRKITCNCEQVFNVDIPDTVDLDTNSEVIDQIADGSFLSCICPTCNAVLYTDIRTRFDWPSRQANVLLIPESERFAFLSGEMKIDEDVQLVIGYAELADRIAVLNLKLDPLAIEALKYHLLIKAHETNPDKQAIILFETQNDDDSLEFHIHGLKENEAAVSTLPFSLYDTIVHDIQLHPRQEPYNSLRNGKYLSVKNILIEDE